MYLGTALPLFEAAERWRTTGWSILREQSMRQIRPDGTYFEQALYYHRYTSDIFHHALLLADANGWARDPALCARVERLDEFLVHAVHPDGTVPLVGDDDGGRLLRLDGLPTRDARPTLATGAAMFERGDMRAIGGDAMEECLWLLGDAGARSLAATAPAVPTERSRGFRDGGFYVLRDAWRPESTWMLVDGGPHGALNCGHAHADALALEVSAGGKPVLTESGTFSYTGAERDAFRATAAHNTATVDGESSSVPAGLFHWRHIAHTTVHAWGTSPSADFWRGSHDGYRRLADPATHERSILLLRGRYAIVLDALVAEGAHEWSLHWHVAPDLEVSDLASNAVAITDPSRTHSDLLELVSLGDGTLRRGTSSRSEAYGARRYAPALTYVSKGTGRQQAVTLLLPPPARARMQVAETGYVALDVVAGSFRDLVMRRGSAASLQVAGLDTDAECAILTNAGAGDERVYLHGASFVEGDGHGRQSVPTGSPYSAQREDGRWVARPILDRSPE